MIIKKSQSYMKLVMARLRSEHCNGTSAKDANALVRDMLQCQDLIDKQHVAIDETTQDTVRKRCRKQ